MNVEKILKKKEILEKKITVLINEFIKKTNINIDDIKLIKFKNDTDIIEYISIDIKTIL